MKVLVTGVAGFIASRVADLLLEAGHEVVGLDDLNDAYDPRLKRWRLHRLSGRDGFHFEAIDVADLEGLRRLFRERSFEAVVNLAARAGVRQSLVDPWVYLRTNTTGTLNLLELCREHGILRFVLASTSSLYGAHNPMPFREDADTSRPLSPYAASKKGAEALAATYHHLYGFHVTVLRYFTVYGPAGRPDMAPFRFVQWISEKRPVIVYGDGEQERDFTFVDDVARGTIAALDLDGYNVVNLGTDRPVRLNRLISLVEDAVGRRARLERREPHRADVRATWASIDRARELLEWEPTVPLEVGVTRTVDWYRENRDWAKDIDCGV